MISIQSSLSELERLDAKRAVVLDCYVQAIRSSALYAVDLDGEITAPYCKHLTALADQIASAETGVVADSRATFRGMLRQFRDQAAHYLHKLRDELAGTTRALEETLDSLSQSDGNHEKQLRTAVGQLRVIAQSGAGTSWSAKVLAAASSVEDSVEEIRKQHQLTVTQFLAEIRVLHKRIEALETASSIDVMTGLFSRGEIEDRIRAVPAGSYYLMLLQVRGLRRAEVQFGPEVSEQLAGAFTKRLKNTVPENTAIGRWSKEEFVAVISDSKDKQKASAFGKWISEQLSGAYACMQSGKAVRPSLQLTVGIVESTSKELAERTLERVGLFLTGAP